MSFERAIKAINLEKTDKIPQQETIDHPEYMHKLLGLNPYKNPIQAYVDTYKKLDIDWIWGIPRRAVKFNEGESAKQSKNGSSFYTEWGLAGSEWKKPYFSNVEEVLRYDPLINKERIGIVTEEHNLSQIRAAKEDQRLMGNSALVTGLYYTTLFQFPIMVFGYELSSVAALTKPNQFKKILKKFAEISIENAKAWANSNIRVIACHDDIAIARGLFFPPQWYRENIFPWYKEIWKPIKERNLKVIFISDGDYTPLVDDLTAIGADGFIVNESMDLPFFIKKFGGSKVILGNMDTRLLTFGTPEQIKEEVLRCFSQAGNCPGYFLKTVGDIPHNVPLSNVEAYFETCRKYRNRGGPK